MGSKGAKEISKEDNESNDPIEEKTTDNDSTLDVKFEEYVKSVEEGNFRKKPSKNQYYKLNSLHDEAIKGSKEAKLKYIQVVKDIRKGDSNIDDKMSK